MSSKDNDEYGKNVEAYGDDPQEKEYPLDDDELKGGPPDAKDITDTRIAKPRGHKTSKGRG